MAIVFILALSGLQLWPGASELLRFSRPSYAQGAFWQPLTAQWVHLSAWHASGNALAFALIVVASSYWVRWPLQMLALLGGFAGVAAVVVLDPDCSYYAGASGALHGLLAGNLLSLGLADRSGRRPACRGDHGLAAPWPRWRRGFGTALLGAMALRLWLQSRGALEGVPGAWSFPVYWPAHCAGALGGIGLVAAALAWHGVTAPETHPQQGQ